MLVGKPNMTLTSFGGSSTELNYTIHKNFSLIVRWHSEYDLGGGVEIRF
jgi:hypothetical protein